MRVEDNGSVEPAETDRWLAVIPTLKEYWYEVVDSGHDPAHAAQQLEPLLASLLQRERDTLEMAKTAASRYEEIELIYTISETLGGTLRLEEAAQRIVEAVSEVVGARRSSIMVYDADSKMLRAVAGIGTDVAPFGPIAADDPDSIAARVLRERRVISSNSEDVSGASESGAERTYRGRAFISVPIIYPAPDGTQRPVGVINLTDRAGPDAFSDAEQRLVTAIASQIGVAIENSHLMARDREQQRLRRELELAHDLQLKLLPSPDILGPKIDVAAHCQPAESVGGDFYNFVRLPEGRVGVMLGDVSSHGFASALIMALVLSAAGIHAAAAASPDEALRSLFESIRTELAETEMHLALFYGVADRARGGLRYANAGHPHAFRISRDGKQERLAATSPPLGLAEPDALSASETEWTRQDDLLVLFSDGITDATNEAGEQFGEARVLEIVDRHRDATASEIVKAVVEAVDEYAPSPSDDRTILVLRA